MNHVRNNSTIATDCVDDAKATDTWARRIVMLLSRGSLSLRLGRYQTQEELDARREALKKFEF